MKLRYSPTSPFVRKVMVTAHETGLADQIEKIATNVWAAGTDIGADNPVGKVPCLTTDGGEIIYDSSVICEYLDSLHDGQKLFPPVGGARWRALRLNALGDGMCETGIRRLLETRLWPDSPRQDWIDRANTVLGRCFKSLEDDADALSGPVTIGQVAIGCAIGWLDLRFSDFGWRDDCPALADWYAGFSARPSMAATEPKE
ncbi:MAG: glutathione S-transferase [Rhodospirillales bacterium CG15_BIG_FIL_POST_REV_8_21_14_020_66_15]|nr:MAG: glutathione S-transferase [Rhodospirillales bacterium CG15_BIG_FIL_POST_REV_8_21_14_020_66_15]